MRASKVGFSTPSSTLAAFLLVPGAGPRFFGCHLLDYRCVSEGTNKRGRGREKGDRYFDERERTRKEGSRTSRGRRCNKLRKRIKLTFFGTGEEEGKGRL